MKLLIVDDDADLRQMLQAHFEDSFGGKVFTAGTASEALRMVEEEQPEGMLLDLNLGSRLTGFDVLERARKLSPSTKVIMVTGVNDIKSIEKALALGAVDYVTKPFTVGYLQDTVDSKILAHLAAT